MVPLARDLERQQKRLRLRPTARRGGRRPRPPPGDAPRAQPAPAPPGDPRRPLGAPDRRRPDGRHLQGGLEPRLAARAGAGAHRRVRRGHHHRGGRLRHGRRAGRRRRHRRAHRPHRGGAGGRAAGRAGRRHGRPRRPQRAPARHAAAHGGRGAAGPRVPLRQRAPGRHRRRPRGAARHRRAGGRRARDGRALARRRVGCRAAPTDRERRPRAGPGRRPRAARRLGRRRWPAWPASTGCTGRSPAGPSACCSTPAGWSPDQAARRLSLALSRVDVPAGAAWLDGFLAGDAALLVHDEGLLRLVDEWVAGVAPDAFDDLLPVLRRTFSAFSRAERRLIQDRVRRLEARRAGDGAGGPGDGRLGDPSVDPDRAAARRRSSAASWGSGRERPGRPLAPLAAGAGRRRPVRRRRRSTASTNGATPCWRRSTTPTAPAGSAPARPGSPGGWATSARTSRARSSR